MTTHEVVVSVVVHSSLSIEYTHLFCFVFLTESIFYCIGHIFITSTYLCVELFVRRFS